jgi:hypothetical protein
MGRAANDREYGQSLRDIAVIYIFERDTENLRLETRYSQGAQLYEIIWRRADGTTTRETFSGETSFRTRLDEIYGQLEGSDWRHVGPPQLLAGGWKI